MIWNYRIMRTPTGLGLCEVYYEDDEGKKKKGWSDPVTLGGYDSRRDLIADLEMMLADAKKRRPTLEDK